MSADYTPPEAAVEAAAIRVKCRGCGSDPDQQCRGLNRTTFHPQRVVDARAALTAAAPHMLDDLQAEVERLRDPLRPADADEDTRATWTTGWRSFDSLSRKSAITTCHALVDMRDRAIRRYELAEERLDEAREKLAGVAALVEDFERSAGEARGDLRDAYLDASRRTRAILADHAQDNA